MAARLSRHKYRARKNREARPVIEALLELYPHTFNWWRPRPLKLGIDQDLLSTGLLTEVEMRAALRLYCNTAQYTLACRAGAERVDLDGNVVGSVTLEEQRHWPIGSTQYGNGTSTRAARLDARPQRQTTTQRKNLRRLQKAQAQALKEAASGA